ncbi:MAG: GntR family transcriptional regulator [Sphaerochaetaceae bacterium]|nr:GntR family transcriptional regulator [Sphaerochaetaceae bacterium]
MDLDNRKEIPIFQKIAKELEDAIFLGAYEEESQIPSTTEISMQFKINPATVLKGMNLLSEKNLIYKKRGIGMFVCKGARKIIKENHSNDFNEDFVKPLVVEAKKLEFENERINFLIKKEYESET